MKASQSLVKVLVAGVFLAILSGCIGNPFGDDSISSGYRQISGSIQLHDGSSPKGVYVWLEGINIGAYSDKDGDFTLTLPSKSSHGTPSGLSGIFNLYFYSANYQLDSAQAVVQDGEFVYDRGDINEDGRLSVPMVMKRFLRINTIVEPASVATNYTGTVGVTITLTATIDSSTVIIPNSVGGMLGAILVKKTDSQEVIIYRSAPLAGTRAVMLVGLTPRNISMTFTLFLQPLAPNDYEVIPYLLIAHEAIPEDLIESLGPNVKELGPDYLKIPFQREGGRFEVD